MTGTTHLTKDGKRDTRYKIQVPPDEPIEPSRERPYEWWVALSREIIGKCPKCGAVTEGKYIPVNSFHECGIVEQCRMCGWEKMRLKGLGRVPIYE